MASHKTRLEVAAAALALAVAGGVAAAQEPPSPPPPGCPNPEPRHACHILASPDGDNVQAEGFTPRSSVTFEIYNTPGGRRVFGPVTKKTDANGNQEVCLSNPHSCLEGDYGDLLTTGSEVKVTDVASGTVKTLVTTPLSVDAVDAAAVTVSG